ncbi:shikimate dehydrogenase family protein [Salegentibacter salarius]|uniref:Shikimate dehydrogenase n=2 Tax=Salegentibacter salarius TaxID=435906 RepID=A0A2N0TXS1_9FLAO|nr:shikimate dehydrogenase [Salegentibacter salarius]OEY73156.1 shikimate dehydrogenase [Salegentibacter salarius]PKD19550.1 shikimate dehydrogenase [Salegentibacter salarius]SLJ99053.1 shikimate dehydrogenase [Salegentibacter salarius]
MKTFGLIGKNISYSFSRTYFTKKFKKENIDAKYYNFDLENINQFRDVIKEMPDLQGLNVTIPYKQEIITFLDDLAPEAKEIGAVNTIKVNGNRLIGYNTDYIGFSESIKPLLKSHHNKALILGTGGASKAIAYAFKKLDIEYKFVSRSSGKGKLGYDDLSEETIKDHNIIINTTPVGTFPDVEEYPKFPVEYLTKNHLVYDLIYNPEVTQLLALAKKQGATIKNGLKMLELQAESAWNIWNK